MRLAKILIVDDEHDLVETCTRILERLGNDCVAAYTGPQAIGLIDSERPDLVVTDLNLPELDGFAVARYAHMTFPPIPVILITAYDGPDTVRAAREAGASEYLSKPFSTSDFTHAVERLLER